MRQCEKFNYKQYLIQVMIAALHKSADSRQINQTRIGRFAQLTLIKSITESS